LRCTSRSTEARHLSTARPILLLWVALVAPVSPAGETDDAAPPPAPPKSRLQAYAFGWSWNRGLQYGVDVPDPVETWEDEELRWRPLLRGDVGLRLAIDAVGVRQHGEWVDLDDDVGVRRAYLYANGNVQRAWKPLSYKLEVGIVKERFSLRNASLAVHEIPYAGTFRIGAFDAPMSLSYLSSSRASPLMEPGMVVDALAPGTLSGAMLSNHLPDSRVTWATGFLSEGDDADTGDESDALARFVGRVTWLPWRTAASLLHLGLSGSWAFVPIGEVHFASSPESFFAPDIVDTGEFDARQSVLLGAEAAWVRGRTSLQGEYLQALVLRDEGTNLRFGGFYLMASWFLTPDSRAYNDADAAFSSLEPARPLSWRARHIGAVEAALRFSNVDLTDGDIRGGRAFALTSGLNWYWNHYVRLQFDVGYTHASGGPRPGDAAVLQTRFDLLI
jgi:phosphate-selective porin OprO/OprP